MLTRTREAGRRERGQRKPEPGGGGIGVYLSGLSGARPGKPVKPPETGDTEIRPPGGLRQRRDHDIDWFTSCFVVQRVRRPGKMGCLLIGSFGGFNAATAEPWRIRQIWATRNRKARIWPGRGLRTPVEGSQEGYLPRPREGGSRVDRCSGGAVIGCRRRSGLVVGIPFHGEWSLPTTSLYTAVRRPLSSISQAFFHLFFPDREATFSSFLS